MTLDYACASILSIIKVGLCLTQTCRRARACPEYLPTFRHAKLTCLAWLDPRHKGKDDVEEMVGALFDTEGHPNRPSCLVLVTGI
jgi:hypothetical protein